MAGEMLAQKLLHLVVEIKNWKWTKGEWKVEKIKETMEE
jgi:hypothetical protein